MSVWCYLPFVFIPVAAVLFYCLGYNFALKRKSELWLDRHLDPVTERSLRSQTPTSSYFSGEYDNVPQQQKRQTSQQTSPIAGFFSVASGGISVEEEGYNTQQQRQYGPYPPERNNYNARAIEEGRYQQQQPQQPQYNTQQRYRQEEQQPIPYTPPPVVQNEEYNNYQPQPVYRQQNVPEVAVTPTFTQQATPPTIIRRTLTTQQQPAQNTITPAPVPSATPQIVQRIVTAPPQQQQTQVIQQTVRTVPQAQRNTTQQQPVRHIATRPTIPPPQRSVSVLTDQQQSTSNNSTEQATS